MRPLEAALIRLGRAAEERELSERSALEGPDEQHATRWRRLEVAHDEYLQALEALRALREKGQSA